MIINADSVRLDVHGFPHHIVFLCRIPFFIHFVWENNLPVPFFLKQIVNHYKSSKNLISSGMSI